MKKFPHATFKDNRGSYTPISTTELGMKWDQCSISVNENQYTFRGLHYQTDPPQTKYIKVIQGSILDFAVDLESNQTEYAVIDTDEALLIPNTKAHGFLTLEPNTIVCYLVEGDYNPNSEHSIVWHTNEIVKNVIESVIGINSLTISDKDLKGK